MVAKKLFMKKKRWDIFLCSVFFVLGFSVIFSILGVLLQSILLNVSFEVQKWLGRIGGVLIILFGLYLLGLIKIGFLSREYKLNVNKKFNSKYLTSFVFGAAFAVGWTPCIGPVLGAVLTLAISQPYNAFFLLLAYSLGLGVPFILVGLFINQAQRLISRLGIWLKYLSYLFGTVLILLGILVFVNQLGRIASLSFVSELLIKYNLSEINFMSINLGVAFLGGLISFLSPCVLPLIPAFLTYLGTLAVKNE